MKKIFLMMAVAALLGVSQPAKASGELTYLPNYSFGAKKFDPTRFGLYVDESMSSEWSYSSWTGIGRVYLQDQGFDTVKWYTTEQDVTRVVNPWLRIGAGAGYSFTQPSANSEVDAHAVVRIKLW